MIEGELPRVLFVTPCAFNAVTGGGVTFGNLFRGWPADRLATVTHDPVPVSRAVCRQYYFVGEAERRRPAPLAWAARAFAAGPSRAAGAGAPRAAPGGAASPSAPGRWVRRAARFLLPEDRARPSGPLREWVAAFAPEVLYTICGDLVTMDLVDALQRERELPLVVHLMDEGMTVPEGRGLFRGAYRRAHGRLLGDLLRRAHVRMAIGEAMAREYRERYGVPFESFQNTIEVSRFDALRRPPGPRNDPPRLVYVGAIHPVAQDRSLEAVAHAVDALRRQGVELRLEVHSPAALFGEYRRRLEVGPNVRFLDAPEDDERFAEILCDADALVLPVNFDPASVRFIRLSMPTKLPAYLASGTPVLVYGPRGVAQVDDAVEEGWGRVVERPDPAVLAKALQEIVADLPLRSRLAERAVATARRRHDAPQVRARFRAALAGAARGAAPS